VQFDSFINRVLKLKNFVDRGTTLFTNLVNR